MSDLMSAVVSPLHLYRVSWGFSEWNIPAFLCPVIIFQDVNKVTRICANVRYINKI